MNDCKQCGYIPNIPESGQLLLRTRDSELEDKVEKVIKSSQLSLTKHENHLMFVCFKTKMELKKIVSEIDEIVAEDDLLYATYSMKEDVRFARFVPFKQLYERISNWKYVEIINEGKFTQYMQPIFTLDQQSIYGYEFLVRPINDTHTFNPGSLFSFSQRAGLQSLLDSQARIRSIELSAKHLSKGVKRFINFLPSSIYDPNHCLKSTLQAVERVGVDPNDLVFEVVETEKILDMSHLKNIFKVYQERGIHVALDDLGSGFATVDVLRELKPNFAKMDRALIDHCDQSKEKQEKIQSIVHVAETHGITLLAEGIERKEEVEFCKSINIPLAQGYYFGKPGPEPVKQ